MNKIKNIKKGFTLLELLVVVLIIGILTAIALPQYQKVVLKSKLTAVKNNAQTLARAVQHYYLIYDKAPDSLDDLDINIPKSHCYFNYRNANIHEIKCNVSSGNKQVSYIAQAYYKSSKIDRYCYTFDINNLSSISNKVCQEETKRTSPNQCPSNYCSYQYP